MTIFIDPTSQEASENASLPLISEIEHLPIFKTILAAIESHRIIKLKYDRDPDHCDIEPRLFSPYLIRIAKKGDFVVLGMQNSNPNSREDYDQRRTFKLEKITSADLTDTVFMPVDTFTPFDKAHAEGIIACVLPWK